MTNVLEQQWSRNDADNSEDTIALRFERQMAGILINWRLSRRDFANLPSARSQGGQYCCGVSSLPSQRDRPIVLFIKDEATRAAAMLGALKAGRIFSSVAPNSPRQWPSR